MLPGSSALAEEWSEPKTWELSLTGSRLAVPGSELTGPGSELAGGSAGAVCDGGSLGAELAEGEVSLDGGLARPPALGSVLADAEPPVLAGATPEVPAPSAPGAGADVSAASALEAAPAARTAASAVARNARRQATFAASIPPVVACPTTRS